MIVPELPENYKELVFCRRWEQKRTIVEKFVKSKPIDYSNFKTSVDSFTWEYTFEGEDFWYQVYIAKIVKELPVIPRGSYRYIKKPGIYLFKCKILI